VLRALGAFCPELRVVAEESYENPEAPIPESDDFADLPGDVAATIAPFPAAPNAVAPVTAEARRALAGVTEAVVLSLPPKTKKRRAAFGLASALTGAGGRVAGDGFRRPAGRHQRVRRRRARVRDVSDGRRRGRLAGGGHHRPAVFFVAIIAIIGRDRRGRRVSASDRLRRPRRVGRARARRDGSRTGRVGKIKPPPRFLRGRRRRREDGVRR
jgi:hypothetical protein